MDKKTRMEVMDTYILLDGGRKMQMEIDEKKGRIDAHLDYQCRVERRMDLEIFCGPWKLRPPSIELL